MDRLAAIIRWLSKHPKSTVAQIAAGVDMEDRYVETQLKQLCMAGYCDSSEARKGTVYEVRTVTTTEV